MSGERISIAESLRWTGLSQGGRTLLQIVGIAALARLLMPSDYGLMAMAATVTVFAGLLRDMGTGTALVQKRDLGQELINAVFWFNILLGISLSVLTALAAPLLAWLFRDERLAPVLLWLAPVLLIESFAIAQRSLFERNAQFKQLAAIELTSAAVALLVALVLAWQGMGVYALVVQSATSASLLVFLLWQSSSWRPGRFRLHGLRDISAFSGNLFAFNLLNYLHRNADNMLIGRYLGSTDLGIYNLAYRVLLFPLQNLTFVINRAMLPAYSRQQSNSAGIVEHYARMLRGIALLTAPLMGLLWAMREPFVESVFGARWMPAAGVIAWLAPVGFLQSIISTSGVVLSATGNTRVLRNLGLVGVPLMLLSFMVGLRWGVVGVAAAYCIVNLFWIFVVLKATLAVVGRSARDVLSAWGLPCLLALACSMGLRFISNLWWSDTPSAMRLLFGILLGGSVYAACSWLLFQRSILQLLSTFHVGEVSSDVPRPGST